MYWLYAGARGSTLAALLGRFQCVAKLFASSPEIINPLIMTISMGMCKNLRELHIGEDQEHLPAQALDSLSTAIEASAMPLLEKLTIEGSYRKNGVRSLLRGFCKGACPQIR